MIDTGRLDYSSFFALIVGLSALPFLESTFSIASGFIRDYSSLSFIRFTLVDNSWAREQTANDASGAQYRFRKLSSISKICENVFRLQMPRKSCEKGFFVHYYYGTTLIVVSAHAAYYRNCVTFPKLLQSPCFQASKVNTT